jgi:hypothetical protein
MSFTLINSRGANGDRGGVGVIKGILVLAVNYQYLFS